MTHIQKTVHIVSVQINDFPKRERACVNGTQIKKQTIASTPESPSANHPEGGYYPNI